MCIPRETGAYFFEYDYLIFGLYTRELDRIWRNKVRIAIVRGEDSGDAWYARTIDRQSEIIGCKALKFPGHHLAFAMMPDIDLQALSRTLQDLRVEQSFMGPDCYISQWNQKTMAIATV